MPFLTLEDPNASIRGSRDPLGMQPIWSTFGRDVVTNLTTQSSSVRGFTTLLLGRYFGQLLFDEGTISRESLLDVFLRMEQLCAYVRYVGHGVEGEIRGIERIKANLQKYGKRVLIQSNHRGMILADQKVYGLWGLYSVPARVSKLISEGPLGVTDPAREFLEELYLPALKNVMGPLKRILAHGGTLDTRSTGGIFGALGVILSPRFTPEEEQFYGHYIRDAGEVSDTMDGRQRRFRQLLAEHTSLEEPVGRTEMLRVASKASRLDEGLCRSLNRILVLESLLAPADALFNFILTQNRQTPKEAEDKVAELWGRERPKIDLKAFKELGPQIQKSSGTEVADLMNRCSDQLVSGQYSEAFETLMEWNRLVMVERKAGPWIKLDDRGRIDVRYMGLERLLPTREELSNLWRHSYFVDSLKTVTQQLRKVS